MEQRSLRYELLGQRGLTIWFTGLSASGKSTISYGLENKLLEERRLCYCLDGGEEDGVFVDTLSPILLG